MPAHLSRGAVPAKTGGARRQVHRRGLVSRRLVDVIHRDVQGQSHLWRQRSPNGRPQQITFGPSEEYGLVVEQDGRSIITSIGVHESSIWIHDAAGERSLSSEGEIAASLSPPSFEATIKPSTTFCAIRTRMVARNSGA